MIHVPSFIPRLPARPPRARSLFVLAVSLLVLQSGVMAQAIKRFPQTGRVDSSIAVQVDDGPLAYTGQILGWDAAGAIGGDARAQSERALANLGVLLAEAGGDLSGVVRLDVYVTEDAAVDAFAAAVARTFAGGLPAVSYVRTPLVDARALVAVDAVARVAPAGARVRTLTSSRLPAPPPGAHLAVMPAGSKVFISGQADPAQDLATGTRLTMASLGRSLAHLGLDKSHVVQVKAFNQPFADHAAFEREVAAFFAGGPVPPIIQVEWYSSLPTEIELVAAGQEGAQAEPIVFSDFPGLPNNPRYSRATVVAAGHPLIFIAGLYAENASDPRGEMRDIFAQLGSVLFETRSSYRLLVKATYYTLNTDRIARQTLNEIRAVYYNPAGPPAASALAVSGVGRPGKSASISMVAIPRRGGD